MSVWFVVPLPLPVIAALPCECGTVSPIPSPDSSSAVLADEERGHMFEYIQTCNKSNFIYNKIVSYL